MIKNVLKEDFYRLKRSKTLWICLTVAVVFSFLITAFYNFAIELAGEYGVYTGVDLNEYMAPELMAAMAFFKRRIADFLHDFCGGACGGRVCAGNAAADSGYGRGARWSVFFLSG